jgi:hypothetical protein
MEDLVKYLIKCEEEAKDKIDKSFEYLEHMKKQALHDAKMELSLIESEYDQKIEEIKNKYDESYKKLQKSLEAEYINQKNKYETINCKEIVSDLANIVSGKTN